jgi:hypothetical protein
MSAAEVEAALGKPDRIVAFDGRTRWTYPDGLIVILENDRVVDVKF